MNNEEFRLLIERGDVVAITHALALEPQLANRPIHWYLNQHNTSDPLHYVSDCVGHGWLTNGAEGDIAAALLAAGAALDGSPGKANPLIAAASLCAEKVAKVLIEAGAKLDATSVFGARALHWAAWCGLADTVARLIAHHDDIEARCTEFGATPLFWAVHGFGPQGSHPKRDQVGAAQLLIEAGALIDTANKQRVSAIELADTYVQRDMYDLLAARGPK